MSKLSQALTGLMDKNALKKGKLAKKTNLGKKQLSRILSGKTRFVDDADFKRLAKAVTLDKIDQAHLIAARMLDVCNGPGKQLVSIHIKTDQVKAKNGK